MVLAKGDAILEGTNPVGGENGAGLEYDASKSAEDASTTVLADVRLRRGSLGREDAHLGQEYVKDALSCRGHLSALFHIPESLIPPRNIVIAKTIIFTLNTDSTVIPVVVVLPNETRIDEQRLADALGADRASIQLCPEERLVAFCGHKRGEIGPVGLRWEDEKSSARYALDASLLQAEWIMCGAGERNVMCALDCRDFQKEMEATGRFVVF